MANEIENVPYSALTRCNVVSIKICLPALSTSCVSRSIKIVNPNVEKKRSESLMIQIENENNERSQAENVLNTINENSDIGYNVLNGTLL